jgi:capsular polysaccharide biosynthesis protein
MLKRIKNIWQKPIQALDCVSESWERLEKFCQENDIKLTKFHEKSALNPVSITAIEENPHPYLQNFHSEAFIGVLEINQPGFYFSNHHLISPKNEIIYHIGVPFQILPAARQPLQVKSAKKIKGTVAYLSNTAVNHYDHWLRLILPILRIYRDYGYLDKIDYFYIGEVAINQFMAESLRMLGIPLEKIINYPCNSEKLISVVSQWPKQHEDRAYLDQKSYQFIREEFLKPIDLSVNCCYGSRVYISRGKVNWRKVINEAAVIDFLKPYDFEFRVMDNLSIQEQIKIFYFANTLIAPHGSALTNLFFSQAKNKVLEIFPADYTYHSSFTLAAHSQCQYFYFHSSPISQSNVLPAYMDMQIDLNKLEKALMKMEI